MRVALHRVALAFLWALFISEALAQSFTLKNSAVVAEFDAHGLSWVENTSQHARTNLVSDEWSITIDEKTLRSQDVSPAIRQANSGEIVYDYRWPDYQMEVTYRLESGWGFLTKRITVVRAPGTKFRVQQVVPWDVTAKDAIVSDFVPSIYTPQFGQTIEQSRQSLPGKDLGTFLRFPNSQGLMLNVQNPYLEAHRSDQAVTIAYSPKMDWDQSWGNFESDPACIGAYHLSGRRLSREMVKEWQPAPIMMPDDGMDEAEVQAYTSSVQAFLLRPSSSPISVEVAWTLNDYQIDVGTEEGRAEYKRIIKTASELGIHTLLYAPGNSEVSDRTKSADTWSWEYVLWLGLGEKIRRQEWNPGRDAVPPSIAEMLDYAKQQRVGLLAYVYPSIPFTKSSSWLVRRENDRETVPETGSTVEFATLASREFQDYLVETLIAFQRRTGIAGYSFDYTWLNLPGTSSYAQWFGWRRVMESLRKADPEIVIDGRQSYQLYGPWSWLAGSYPHPTGNDEQPESFRPFPDLHFDRVSADRLRFVNYWYRNYEFAPEQVVPGYATHQTERSREVTEPDGRRHLEMMYTRFRLRDWDYLGFKYSFISSIATGGWNNVVDMIPARDSEEASHFSIEDKKWIRDWLEWTSSHKEYLLHTRNILQQPALGHVDGTSAIRGDRGYLFLFNPNYKQMPARFGLDSSIGLEKGTQFTIRETYPQKGRLLGKPLVGVWNLGDTLELQLDGTSATVLEIEPLGNVKGPLLLNGISTLSANSAAKIGGKELTIDGLKGEPGTKQDIGVLMPSAAQLSGVKVNGRGLSFRQFGRYIEVPVQFRGIRFSQAQEIHAIRRINGTLTGSFVIPTRVLDQLTARKRAWPIPWTKEDYESTWLGPGRLLLFFQFANPTDSVPISATLDGRELPLTPAYSSTRVDPSCFVGFYADVSELRPEVRHTIEVRMPESVSHELQGIFFDNIVPQFTTAVGPPQKDVSSK